jgi:hypothetical protein
MSIWVNELDFIGPWEVAAEGISINGCSVALSLRIGKN